VKGKKDIPAVVPADIICRLEKYTGGAAGGHPMPLVTWFHFFWRVLGLVPDCVLVFTDRVSFLDASISCLARDLVCFGGLLIE
jgi:hypothetical protein